MDTRRPVLLSDPSSASQRAASRSSGMASVMRVTRSPYRRPISATACSGGADHGERPQHFVVDRRRHPLPLTAGRHPVQLLVQVAPSVDLEHPAIGGGRSVEGDLLPDRPRPGRQLRLRVPRDDHRRPGDLEPAEAEHEPPPRRATGGRLPERRPSSGCEPVPPRSRSRSPRARFARRRRRRPGTDRPGSPSPTNRRAPSARPPPPLGPRRRSMRSIRWRRSSW